jgi:hypothetical protein
MGKSTLSPTDLSGQRFGRLIAVRATGERRHGCAVWECLCECGGTVFTRADGLLRGRTKSCGCLQRAVREGLATHGMSRSPEYRAWWNLKERCGNPRNPSFPYYGGRGIRVCDKWLGGFETFLTDVGPRPTPQHSIDRIDVDGNYEPGNVRWATAKEQANNRRPNSRECLLTYQGETRNVTEWAKWAGLEAETLFRRLRRGWSLEQALSAPLRADREKSPRKS